uniref:Rx N-terminal domain-containing protein n=1 Tax=Oryza brachyantha TaxID=4533 RepID=J3N701_ORYBR
MSASLGAMGSLLRKLHVAEYQVTESAKEGIGLLKQDLEVVNAAMVDLSETETCTTMARHWMNQVRDLSYDIEDYIDNTMPSSSSSSYSDSSADLEPVDPGRIEEFRVSVREARERHQIYELGRCTCTPPRCGFVSPEQRRAAPAPDWKGTSLVGIGKSKIELLNMLSDEAEPKLKVVSILGVGGVGKTALAKQVFRELGGRFGCRAFVQASRMPDTKRILRGILSQVRRHGQLPADCCTVQVLIDEIRQHIQHKSKWFIVYTPILVAKRPKWVVLNASCFAQILLPDVYDTLDIPQKTHGEKDRRESIAPSSEIASRTNVARKMGESFSNNEKMGMEHGGKGMHDDNRIGFGNLRT